MEDTRAERITDTICKAANRAVQDLKEHDAEGTKISSTAATKAYITKSVKAHLDAAACAADLTAWSNPDKLSSNQYQAMQRMAIDAAHCKALQGYMPQARIECLAKNLVDGIWSTA